MINQIYSDADSLKLPVATGLAAGKPTAIGTFVAGALVGVTISAADANDEAIVALKGAYTIPCLAASAITVGTKIYVTSSQTLTTVVGSNALFGHALSALASGTADIDVRVAN